MLGVSIALLVGLNAATANAQAVQATQFKGSGKVIAHTPGVLVVTLANGMRQEVRYCKPGESTVELSTKQKINHAPVDVQVTGAMSPNQLRPGTGVKFRAGIDAQGNIGKAIDEIKTFQPRPQDPLGCVPDGEAKDDVTPYLVTATVLSYKKGTLTVNVAGKNIVAGKTRLSVKLADDLSVVFESQDLARVVPGSDVEIEGGQIGKDVVAAKLIVTLATPPGVKPPKKKEPPAAVATPEKKPSSDPNAPRRVKRDNPGRIVLVN